MGIHHLMIGTWTPPGVIITVAFDDEKLTLELVKKTDIPEDEPISWMAFDVRFNSFMRSIAAQYAPKLTLGIGRDSINERTSMARA